MAKTKRVQKKRVSKRRYSRRKISQKHSKKFYRNQNRRKTRRANRTKKRMVGGGPPIIRDGGLLVGGEIKKWTGWGYSNRKLTINPENGIITYHHKNNPSYEEKSIDLTKCNEAEIYSDTKFKLVENHKPYFFDAGDYRGRWIEEINKLRNVLMGAPRGLQDVMDDDSIDGATAGAKERKERIEGE